MEATEKGNLGGFILSKFLLGVAYIALLVLDFNFLESAGTLGKNVFHGAFIVAVLQRIFEVLALACFCMMKECRYIIAGFTFATATWCLVECCVQVPPLFFFLPVVFVVLLDFLWIFLAFKLPIKRPLRPTAMLTCTCHSDTPYYEESLSEENPEELLPAYSP